MNPLVCSPEDVADCELCGEALDAESGMFTDGGDVVIAHSQCGVDEGLEMA
jgi:hypothetical protein